MSAGEMSDGSPVTPQYDARMLAELREWRRRLAPTSLDGNRWSARLTIDELDMLLRVAAERDALKAAACAEWEADIPAEIRERAAEVVPIPWPETMIRAHGHDGTATDEERARCPICNGIA